MGVRVKEPETGQWAQKYKRHMPKELLEIMKNGGGMTEFCDKHDITKQAFYNWLKKHFSFAQAYEIGKIKSELHWMRVGEANLLEYKDGPKFNNTVYKMIMSHRFGWTDNRKIKLDNFSNAQTAVEKVSLLSSLLEKEQVTTQELQAVTNLINSCSQIEQTELLCRRIEALEKAINEEADTDLNEYYDTLDD